MINRSATLTFMKTLFIFTLQSEKEIPMAKEKAVVKKEKQDVEMLTPAEQKKVDEAVQFINSKGDATARSLIEIGQYLLKTFFDGDIKKVEDRGPRKGISLRKIADHSEIMFSYKSLHNATHLAHQEHIFTDPKYKNLTATHKLLLFAVKDDKKKKSYADIVLKENLSVNKLRDRLIESKFILPRGRGTLTEHSEIDDDPFESFIKPIEKLMKLNVEVDNFDVKQLSEDHILALNNLKKRIDALLDKIEKTKK